MKETQISAYISLTTKDLLDRTVRSSGVKKGHLIETALFHHLMALRELPADIIIPAHAVASRKAGEELLERMATEEPTPALRELMAGRGD